MQEGDVEQPKPPVKKDVDWDTLMRDADTAQAGIKAAEKVKDEGGTGLTQLTALVGTVAEKGGADAAKKLTTTLSGKATPLKETLAASRPKATPAKAIK